MARAVKMDAETKDRLEELVAEIRLKTDTNVTQQAVLARLVETAIDSRTAFIDSFRETPPSLSEEELTAFNGGMVASGQETSDVAIDEILYG